MITRLIDIAISAWRQLLPWFIVDETKASILLRFGKFQSSHHSGIHFKLPIVDKILTETIVFRCHDFYEQSLQTVDSGVICISIVCGYRVVDIKKYLLNCESPDDVLKESSMSIIANRASKRTTEEIMSQKFLDDSLEIANGNAMKYGIEIQSLGFINKFKYDIVLKTS